MSVWRCLCVSPFWGLPCWQSRSCYRDTGLMCVCMQVSVCLTFVLVFLPAGRECSVSPRHRTDVCLYVGVCVSHLSVFFPAGREWSVSPKHRFDVCVCMQVSVCLTCLCVSPFLPFLPAASGACRGEAGMPWKIFLSVSGATLRRWISRSFSRQASALSTSTSAFRPALRDARNSARALSTSWPSCWLLPHRHSTGLSK